MPLHNTLTYLFKKWQFLFNDLRFEVELKLTAI